MITNTHERFDLTGKVAIVTGASKGIGEAIGWGLAQFGAKVVLSSRKQEAVDRVAKSMRLANLDAVGIAAHMGDANAIEQLVVRALEAYGGVDIVVNNAAANPYFGPLVQADDAVFDKIMSVNLRGPLELGKRVHPIMAGRGGGSVINIASVGGIKPEPGLGLYSVSKASLISLTKVMAHEWGSDSIRANVICPGLIKTKFSEALWNNDAILERFLQHAALQRVGEPDDLVGLAVYLASDASRYATGGVYLVDGGLLA